jgi:hypothetical protein
LQILKLIPQPLIQLSTTGKIPPKSNRPPEQKEHNQPISRTPVIHSSTVPRSGNCVTYARRFSNRLNGFAWLLLVVLCDSPLADFAAGFTVL